MQRYVLAVLYFATDGPNWKERSYWLTGRHECSWLFVICSDVQRGGEGNDYDAEDGDDDYQNFLDEDLGMSEGKAVIGLSLYGQGLEGTIPREIQALEFLRVLDLGVSFIWCHS